MNTVKLPELPSWGDVVSGMEYTHIGHERMKYVQQYATAYARAAVEASQPISRSLYSWLMERDLIPEPNGDGTVDEADIVRNLDEHERNVMATPAPKAEAVEGGLAEARERAYMDKLGQEDHARRCQPESGGQGGLPESLVALARRCLHIAFVWNDHNFKEAAHVMARKEAEKWGIGSMDDANAWLDAPKEWPVPAYTRPQPSAAVTEAMVTDALCAFYCEPPTDPDGGDSFDASSRLRMRRTITAAMSQGGKP